MGNGAPAGASSSDPYTTEGQTNVHEESVIKEEEVGSATTAQNKPQTTDAAAAVATSVTAEEPADEGKPTVSDQMEEWSFFFACVITIKEYFSENNLLALTYIARVCKLATTLYALRFYGEKEGELMHWVREFASLAENCAVMRDPERDEAEGFPIR